MISQRRSSKALEFPKAVAGELDRGLLGFRLKSLWSAMRREPAPLWLLCLYVTIEYLRPQNMYPAIDVAPWGQISLLLLVVSVITSGLRPRSLSIIDGLFLAFSLAVLVSGINAWDASVSWDKRNTYLSWILLYFCVRSVLTTPRRMLLFWVLLALINFKMSRHGTSVFVERGLSFSRYGINGAPGWFHNSGELAMQMCVAFAMSWTLIHAHQEFLSRTRRNILLLLFPLTAFIAIIASSSRGGQLALVAICIGLIGRSRRAFRGFIATGLLLAIGWSILPAEQKARFASMGDDSTSQARLELWRDAREIAAEYPMTGIGYGNWGAFYSTWPPLNSEHHQQRSAPLVIHNTVLEALVDLGVPGAMLFLSMFVTALMLNHQTTSKRSSGSPTDRSIGGMAAGLNLALAGMMIAAQFMSVLFYPGFWMAFALTASLASLPPVRVRSDSPGPQIDRAGRSTLRRREQMAAPRSS